jgi:hypothetical protein
MTSIVDLPINIDISPDPFYSGHGSSDRSMEER